MPLGPGTPPPLRPGTPLGPSTPPGPGTPRPDTPRLGTLMGPGSPPPTPTGTISPRDQAPLCQQRATVADGTHPNGMLSCTFERLLKSLESFFVASWIKNNENLIELKYFGM